MTADFGRPLLFQVWISELVVVIKPGGVGVINPAHPIPLWTVPNGTPTLRNADRPCFPAQAGRKSRTHQHCISDPPVAGIHGEILYRSRIGARNEVSTWPKLSSLPTM